jgi:ketosteroid isomerase-like protein
MILSRLSFALIFASGAQAEWRAANPDVEEAIKHPRVASALEAIDTIDAAIIAGDASGFMAAFTEDTVVNNPFNTIANREEAARRYATGALTYKYLLRNIEYAAPRRDDEVVFMGEEVYEPPAGHPQAGKTVRRRFTDIWQLQDGEWKLSVRQATVISVE